MGKKVKAKAKTTNKRNNITNKNKTVKLNKKQYNKKVLKDNIKPKIIKTYNKEKNIIKEIKRRRNYNNKSKIHENNNSKTNIKNSNNEYDFYASNSILENKSKFNSRLSNNETRVVYKGCMLDSEIYKNFKNAVIVEDKLIRFNGKGYDVTLNYSNIRDNSNKYYKMQMFELKEEHLKSTINYKEEYEKKLRDIENSKLLTKRKKDIAIEDLKQSYKVIVNKDTGKEEYVLNDNKDKKYFIFFRWGRTGSLGMINLLVSYFII